jgi:hypothetical protein
VSLGILLSTHVHALTLLQYGDPVIYQTPRPIYSDRVVSTAPNTRNPVSDYTT